MKKLFLMVAIMMIGATSAFAQFTNTQTASSYNRGGAYENTKSIKISYLPVKLKGDGGGDISFNGALIEYVSRGGISQNIPLYVEMGLGASWIGGEIEDTGIDLNYFSLHMPLYLGYQYCVNDNFAISPYAGIYLRGNIFGNYKVDGESYNAFDKDDVGDELKLSHFNIGWRIGVNFDFKKVSLGASYGADFNEIVDNGTIRLPQITIGINF